MTWFIDFVEGCIAAAALVRLRELQDGRGRNNWGYEVICYASELFEVLDAYAAR